MTSYLGKECEDMSSSEECTADSTPERKVALITGITGQDGSYLAEFLLEKGYIVHGIIRRASQFNTARIDHLYKDKHIKGVKLFLHFGDLTESSSLCSVISKVRPTEIYILGAMSHVKVSYEVSEYTAQVGGIGTLRLLNAIRTCSLENSCRFYQASTSEMYGKVTETPQKETTPFHPRSPYAVTKVFAYWTVVNYREAYGMFAVNGILFNHESPRRGPTFVTRKITRAVARIKLGLQSCLYLGNLDASRDWGYAKDYVKAMWMMLQASEPEDFVIASGETHTVREFCELAFSHVGITLDWRGPRGTSDEVGVNAETGDVVIKIDPVYFRPAEVDYLLGDASKAKAKLGWQPTYSFHDMVREMVAEDLELTKRGGNDDGWKQGNSAQ